MSKELILSFEKHTKLGATKAAKLLGISYPSYTLYKREIRPPRKFIIVAIEAMMLLPEDKLNILIRTHVYGRTQENN